MEMNDSALTIDQLDALSRAVPDDQERKDVRLYLQACLVHAWPSIPCLACLVTVACQQAQCSVMQLAKFM